MIVRVAGALLGVALLAGCPESDPRPFLGTWQLSGSFALTRGKGPTLQTLSGTRNAPLADCRVELHKGTRADLESRDSAGCVLLWDVSGQTARLLPEQSCTATRGKGSVSLRLEEGSLRLTAQAPDHLLVEGKLSGTVAEGGALFGRTEPATAELHGTLTRVR